MKELKDNNGTPIERGSIFQWNYFPVGNGDIGDMWKVTEIRSATGQIKGTTRSMDGIYTDRQFRASEITLVTKEDIASAKAAIEKLKEQQVQTNTQPDAKDKKTEEKSDDEILDTAVNKKKK